MLELRGVEKRFGEKQVLRGVDLFVPEGKTTAIFGLSGGGKSTIIKLIVRLLEPEAGEIFLHGEDILRASPKRLAELRKEIGFLFQSGALFDSQSVFENVAFPLIEHTRFSPLEIEREVFGALERVGLKPSEVAKLYPHELSGGMRKRVGLARSIILKPKLILYDEPTSGLDPLTSDLITQLIITLQRELKVTSILISHDVKESFKAADSLAMLWEGQIIEHSEREAFKRSENPHIQQFLEGRS